MTSESNPQSAQSADYAESAQLSRTANSRLPEPMPHIPANSDLPAVGDLSKITADPVLNLDLSPIAPGTHSLLNPEIPIPPAAPPPITIPMTSSGVPFAASQAIPAEPIPAALAAKVAADQADQAEAKPTTANDQATDSVDRPTPVVNNLSALVQELDTAADLSATTLAATNQVEESTVSPDQSFSSLIGGNHAPQVRFKNEQGKLLLILPSERDDSSGQNTLNYAWAEIMHQLRQRLQTEARNWKANTAVHLIARDRLLNAQQLQDIVDALTQQKIQLRRVYTSRRQTAITAATAGYCIEQHVAVSQLNPAPTEAGEAMAEPLVLKTTLRSGAEIRHNGTVVVIGDLNPGSAIVAEGDIVVWGRLRGNVHAGYKGDTQARIMALRMEPAQIRIANFVARGPSSTPTQFFPEVAYVTPDAKISIARVEDMREVPG
jgi:septum site-determining protein MinC